MRGAMALITLGSAFSRQITIARAFITFPAHDARRAASSIFWTFSRSTGRYGRKMRMVRRLPMTCLSSMWFGLLRFLLGSPVRGPYDCSLAVEPGRPAAALAHACGIAGPHSEG